MAVDDPPKPGTASTASTTVAASTTVTGRAVAIVLQNNRDEIVPEWARLLKSGSFAGYADVPIDELESACSQCLSAFISTLREGDHAKMRRFVRREVRLRLTQGYHESEIDQLLCTVRLAAWPLIAAEYAADGRAVAAALGLLQHCVDEAIFELSDFYESTAQQQAEQHLAEMEAMNRRLEEISVRDGLTGLYNRRYFADRLTQEFQRVVRHRHPMALLMLDIDHFKRINDAHGHQAGDEVLRGLALVLVNKTRTTDIVCRYGGEEFAVLLPDTPVENAHMLAERLREAIANTSLRQTGTAAALAALPPVIVPSAGGDGPTGSADGSGGAGSAGSAGGVGKSVPCTVSIGVAAHDGSSLTDPAQLIAAADGALYAAKHAGRNRVVLAG